MAGDTDDWAGMCLRVLDAGGDGPERVFAVLTGAARRLTGAAGALVVAWRPEGPELLARSGGALALPTGRPAPGRTSRPDAVVAAVDVHAEVDLVVWWPPASAAGDDLLEPLRLLAALAAVACRRDGAGGSALAVS
ncbi:MAG TPA: hypothetical protein VM367_09560, partial [Pseudonocardia sp.]|nr:hypothetical protein [Pseudonocardia sp.]